MKKFPFHPFLFALYPLIFLIIMNPDPLRFDDSLRAGLLWLTGGLAAFAIFWLVSRSLHRAALLASLGVALLFAYDPVYELLRGQAVMGLVIGKHRFLAPAWAALMAVSGYLVTRRIQPRALTGVFNVAGAGLVLISAALGFSNGAWEIALRTAGMLPPPQVEVTYLDVGRVGNSEIGLVGDSILLRTSEGKAALIDGGYPNEEVTAYLKAQGVTSLDLVVLTHAHDDHSGGLINVLRSLPVGLFVHNGQTLDTPVYDELAAEICCSKVETRVARAGDQLSLGSLVFDVLSPPDINPTNINNGSIVLHLNVGRVSFLFTGDTDGLEQRRLLAAQKTQPVTILKVAHHGAESNFHLPYIKAISPKVAIYSAGTGNIHDLPSSMTLETLRAMGVEVYGTDVNGTIIVRTDGKTYEVIPARDE